VMSQSAGVPVPASFPTTNEASSRPLFLKIGEATDSIGWDFIFKSGKARKRGHVFSQFRITQIVNALIDQRLVLTSRHSEVIRYPDASTDDNRPTHSLN
jgi:hypothetical protein